MNVLAKTKGFFPKATKLLDGSTKRHPTFMAFLMA